MRFPHFFRRDLREVVIENAIYVAIEDGIVRGDQVDCSGRGIALAANAEDWKPHSVLIADGVFLGPRMQLPVDQVSA